jgi:Mg2+/Co2+ transporter CorB
MTLTIGIILGAVLGLVILSAFFSGSETGLTASSRARMHEMARRGDRRAAIVNALRETPERLIGSILLGNNLVNILASALATMVFVQLFGDAGVIYATLVMTALVLIFGEVMPKTYAITHPDRVALAVGPILQVLVPVFAPVVMGVEYIVKRVLRLLGVDTSGADNVLSARDELRGVIALQHKEGSVVKQHRDMLGGILDLKELELSDLMVHRTKMHTIDGSLPLNQIIEELLKSGHTRIPVWTGDPDNIIGVLHAKDLFAALHASGGDTSKIDIEAISSPPWFVPDTTPVDDQLNAFLRRKSHFAIVVDEYGEVMGLVTLEDILEEIVGEISDEHDVAVTGVRREATGSYVVDGTVPIRDLNRLYDWSLPDEEATTIAGLVIHEAQMIPEVGQEFTFHGFRFEVLRKRRHQITLMRVTKL